MESAVAALEAEHTVEALYRSGQRRGYRRHAGSLAAVLPGRTGADCIVLARAPDGRAHGEFLATGIRPTCMDRLETAGCHLPADLFRQRVLLRD